MATKKVAKKVAKKGSSPAKKGGVKTTAGRAPEPLFQQAGARAVPKSADGLVILVDLRAMAAEERSAKVDQIRTFLSEFGEIVVAISRTPRSGP